MNEEEKKAVEILNSWYSYNKKNRNKLLEADKIIKVQETILNLIENQQKELNNLKEIEKSHKEENGKLRVELEQEKEINKEIAIKNHKIKEKIEENKKLLDECDNGDIRKILHDEIRILKEMLEEK